MYVVQYTGNMKKAMTERVVQQELTERVTDGGSYLRKCYGKTIPELCVEGSRTSEALPGS